MKVIRTFPSGCEWCNATGKIPNQSTTIAFLPCPVCGGTARIIVTEEFEIGVPVSGDQIPIRIDNKIILEDILAKIESSIFAPLNWKQLREQAGLTLRQVADMTGVSAATISRIERGVGNFQMDGLTRLKIFYQDEEWKGQKEQERQT